MLAHLSESFGLNESVAAVTVVAFGNCANDAIAAIINFREDTATLHAGIYGKPIINYAHYFTSSSLLLCAQGGSLFIIGFIGGLILIIQPMTVLPRIIARDIIFFASACAFISISFQDQKFTYYNVFGISASNYTRVLYRS